MKHRDRWLRAGRPDLAAWNAPSLITADDVPAQCRLPFCTLWVENRQKVFCKNHEARWRHAGRPDIEQFIVDCQVIGTASIDLRGLPPQLKLEFQYGLQCRADARARTTPPYMVMQAVRLANAAAVASLLDLEEPEWRKAAKAGRSRPPILFVIEAREAVESLRDGTGWEVEYPRDVWRLHKLPGITVRHADSTSRERLRFDRISQPWLRELGKRWTRLRLATGLSVGAAKAGVDALTCFSQFLAHAGVDRLAEVDRPLLERHLGWVAS